VKGEGKNFVSPARRESYEFWHLRTKNKLLKRKGAELQLMKAQKTRKRG
jgi:hypothetical protein